MPNTFAYLMLFIWPFVVLILFRRMPLPAAAVWAVIGGYLFLPEEAGVNLPFVPTYDKDLVPSLAALIIAWVTIKQKKYVPMARSAQVQTPPRARVSGPAAARAGGPLRSLQNPPRRAATAADNSDQTPAARPAEPPVVVRQRGRWIANFLILALFANVFLTGMTNPEPIIAGPRIIQALRPYDMLSSSLGTLVMLLPFFIGRRYLGTPDAHRMILKVLVTAGLVYSAFILIEVRLSPQINRWVYGFYSHSFAQHIRGGGYRPMVFVGHGLRVGIFMAMAVLAALALYRLRENQKTMKWLLLAGWLFISLFLSKTLGAFLITGALIPAAVLLNVRGRLMVGVVIATLVLTYPLLRSSGVLNTDRIMATAYALDLSRTSSFQYRLKNEDILLEKAMQKPLSGWGIWGRNRVYNTETGRDISVTDGIWVIEIGSRGWIGYLAVFGLLTLPVLVMFARQKSLGVEGATAGLVLLQSANLLDLLPNSSLTPVTWLVAGALLARYEMGAVAPPRAQESPPARAAPLGARSAGATSQRRSRA